MRCSSLPLITACPASQHGGEPVINANTPEARVGTAVHAAIALAIQRDAQSFYDVDAFALSMARVHLADVEDVQRLTRNAWDCWLQVRGEFPEPVVELELATTAGELTGHIDLDSVVGMQARIIDWKTGIDADAQQQMMGYAYLVSDLDDGVDSVRATVINVKDKTQETWEWTAEELSAWWLHTRERAKQNAYSAGRHCGFCPRQATCDANRAYLERGAQVTRAIGIGSWDTFLAGLTPGQWAEVMADVLDRCGQLSKVVEQVRDLIKARVESEGGKMVADDGRELVIRQEERREIVAGPETCRLLANAIVEDPGAADYWGCWKVSKTAVEAAVRKHSAPRQGAKNIRELMARLEASGCINTTTVAKLEVRRGVKALEKDNGSNSNADTGPAIDNGDAGTIAAAGQAEQG